MSQNYADAVNIKDSASLVPQVESDAHDRLLLVSQAAKHKDDAFKITTPPQADTEAKKIDEQALKRSIDDLTDGCEKAIQMYIASPERKLPITYTTCLPSTIVQTVVPRLERSGWNVSIVNGTVDGFTGATCAARILQLTPSNNQ